MFDTVYLDSGPKCDDCKGSYGIHTVYCSNFKCSYCGVLGNSPDHFGGCPCKLADLKAGQA